MIFDVGLLAAPAPAMFPAENQMFQQINQNLQTNAPVLLAIEYEPGLSGEMHLAANAVVDQLVAKECPHCFGFDCAGWPGHGPEVVG